MPVHLPAVGGGGGWGDPISRSCALVCTALNTPPRHDPSQARSRDVYVYRGGNVVFDCRSAPNATKPMLSSPNFRSPYTRHDHSPQSKPPEVWVHIEKSISSLIKLARKKYIILTRINSLQSKLANSAKTLSYLLC